jgi:hypothetical protein
MLYFLQRLFKRFLQLVVFCLMMKDKLHHKVAQARIVGYLVGLAFWPSVFGWHTFGIFISVQNGTRHDSDFFETRAQPFRGNYLFG